MLFMEDYQPASCMIDVDEIRRSPNFAVRKFPDAIYIGEVNKDLPETDEDEDPLRQGKGIMLYKNGRIYEGEWRKDLRTGRGYEKYTNGNEYEGDF